MASEQALELLTFVNPHLGDSMVMERVAAAAPRPLPREPTGTDVDLDLTIDGAGMSYSFAEWRAATHSTSLMILHDGVVRYEWYAEGCGPETLFLGASATKSVLSHLVGIAVSNGDLDLDAPVGQIVAPLATSGYANATVRQVMTMISGVDWYEDYRDPQCPAVALLAAFAAGGDSRALVAQVGPGVAPGTRYAYNTCDSQVLDWAREAATGVPFVEALSSLWHQLGAVQDAFVGVDGRGVPLAGGALAASTEDWARIGLLAFDGIATSGERVLSTTHVEKASTPGAPFTRVGRLPSPMVTHAGFGWHWFPVVDGGERFTADGSRGQFVYVDRTERVVIVKTSDWPYTDVWADRQSRDLSYLGLATIADHVSAE